MFDDNCKETARIAWDAIHATTGILQNLLERHSGLRLGFPSPDILEISKAQKSLYNALVSTWWITAE